MNQDRRNRIAEIQIKLVHLQVEIEEVHDEEQEYYDNMPENFQNSDQGSVAVDAITRRQQTFGYTNEELRLEALGEAFNSIEDAINQLANAQG